LRGRLRLWLRLRLRLRLALLLLALRALLDVLPHQFEVPLAFGRSGALDSSSDSLPPPLASLASDLWILFQSCLEPGMLLWRPQVWLHKGRPAVPAAVLLVPPTMATSSRRKSSSKKTVQPQRQQRRQRLAALPAPASSKGPSLRRGDSNANANAAADAWV